MLVSWHKGSSPSHVLQNQTFTVIFTTAWLLSKI